MPNKARIMGSDGNYYHKGIKEGEESINSQEYFYDEAIKASRKYVRLINKEYIKLLSFSIFRIKTCCNA